jgi:small membrane protein
MNWIQVLLLVAAMLLVVFLLRSRGSLRARAWVKVGYLLFMLAGIYAILRPDDTTVLANMVGVRRGTDLMLYALIIAFAFTTLSTYMRFRDVELRYARLARAIALEGAREPTDERSPVSAGEAESGQPTGVWRK